MWWPGSSAKGEEGELDPDDGSPGDGASTPTSDFMEILSEEDILLARGVFDWHLNCRALEASPRPPLGGFGSTRGRAGCI